MMTHLALALIWTIFACATPGSRRQTIIIEQFQYRPAVIRAAVGDTLVWMNRDVVPHTADANDSAWATGNIAGRAQRTTIAIRKGEYAFTCLYHSNMKGKLIVK